MAGAFYPVMAGLVPAIHAFLAMKTWMPGIKPGMTKSRPVAAYSAGFAVAEAASDAALAAASAWAFFSTMRTDQIEPS
jgi:hypothetical protein